MIKTYTITITEKQAATLRDACELMARLGAGQLKFALDYLPLETFRPIGFNDACDRAIRALQPFLTRQDDANTSPYRKRQHETGQTAWDLHQVIRHRLAWDSAIERGVIKRGEPRKVEMFGVHYDNPLRLGVEPLAQIDANGEA